MRGVARTHPAAQAGDLRRGRLGSTAVGLLAGLLFLGGWTVKGTEVTERYYPIAGRSHAELLASVKRHGPRGGSAYGIGFIDFFPGYRFETKSGACRIRDADVGLRIALKLPQWKGPDDAPRSVKRLAARFERAIRAHEFQHVKIAKRHARRMAQALSRMRAEDNCWILRRKANELIARHKKDHLGSQRAFDNRTRKGIKRLL